MKYAELMGEISSISKQDHKLVGHAKDPISCGLSLEAFLPAKLLERDGGGSLGFGRRRFIHRCYLVSNETNTRQ